MISIFVSCVSAEFGRYRTALRADLGSNDVTFVVQEGMVDSRHDTLRKLSDIIRASTIVVHVVGRGAGDGANDGSLSDLRGASGFERFDEFLRHPALVDATLSLTQWEVVLALFHRKPVFVFEASRPILDGHPGDRAFEPAAGDQVSMEAHRRRLRSLRRYATSFDSYQTFKDALSKTIMSDLVGRLRTDEELATLAMMQDDEARTADVRYRRFGTNAVDEFKRVLAMDADVGHPSFVTASLAFLNNGTIGWSFSHDSPTPSQLIAHLVDWAATHHRPATLPALLLLVMRRATALGHSHTVNELTRVLDEMCAATGLTRDAIEGACACAVSLDVAALPEGVLQVAYTPDVVTRSPAADQHAVYRFPGAAVAVRIVGSGGLEDLVERARRALGDNQAAAVVPPKRVEVFASPADINARWEDKRNGQPHPLPVAIRVPRENTDWEDIVDPPATLQRATLPCRLTAVDDIRAAIRAHGLFFAVWGPGERCEPEAVWVLANLAAAGVWIRESTSDEDAFALLADLDGLDLAELPRRVFERRRLPNSLWRHAALMFSDRHSEFPRRRNRQQQVTNAL